MKYNFHSKEFVETGSIPDKLAIAGSDGDIDWNTLKIKVEKLSFELMQLAIPTGHPVLIYGHKEHLFPVAILACIHSSMTYIPIDKIYPLDRIKKIMEITGTQILINCSNNTLELEFAATINPKLETIVAFPPDYNNRIYGSSIEPLQYIMFTSGSTGEPKGVQISYKSMLSFVDWAVRDFGFSVNDVFMNQAPFTFDVSLCDILNSMALGGTLVLTSNDIVKDQNAFLNRIAFYRCSVWTSTPSFAFLFLRHANFNVHKLSSLHTFLFMGEDLPNRTCSLLKIKFPKARVLNAYGPTEATIVTTFIDITEEIIRQHPSIPIGYSKPDSELLIDKINPDDREGELIIVGDHVSNGYLKDDELNAKKFFIHNGKRAFKTGDLAFYEGSILFFIGRNDEQIKMHGYRIELNEISNAICRINIITDAVTVPLKRNNEVKKIVSFVKVNLEISQDELNNRIIPFLEKSLPYYMIPGEIIIVDEFPYNTSHKIDKNKLIADYIQR